MKPIITLYQNRYVWACPICKTPAVVIKGRRYWGCNCDAQQCPHCKKYTVTAEDIADGWLECGKCGYSGWLDIDPPAELEEGELEYILHSFGY